MHVLRVCLCTTGMQYHQGPEEGVGFHDTRVTNGCEAPYELWGLNLGPLQEQLVLLSPESSLQPLEIAPQLGPQSD